MSLKKIYIVRHAESDEDVNPNLNGEVSDSEISITEKGRGQVATLINKLLPLISGYKGVGVIASTSNRAQETARLLVNGLLGEDNRYYYTVEPAIRNLNWGNVDKTNVKEIERERYRVGVLYYSFPGGDHTPTYVDNIQGFTDRCLREGQNEDYPEVLLIVAHGFSMRVITKCLIDMSDADFKWLANPHNCFIIQLSVGYDAVTLDTELPIYQHKNM